ncbi:hypothetical protein J6590_009681 [Homalodisca vitripennis]|nr:hypothetical protein J6590_009681 [Homalodisca vitripennis]
MCVRSPQNNLTNIHNYHELCAVRYYGHDNVSSGIDYLYLPMLWLWVTGRGTQHGASRGAWALGPSRAPEPEPPSSWKYWRPNVEASEDGFPPRRLPYGGGAWCKSCLMGVVVAALSD